MLSAKGQEMEAKSRKKREWILPPAKLMENTDYTHKEFIAKVKYFPLNTKKKCLEI